MVAAEQVAHDPPQDRAVTIPRNGPAEPETNDPAEVGGALGEGPNPVAQAMLVMVSVPDRIEVRMVDASTLSDYEIWGGLASAVLAFASGFFVAWFQDTAQVHFLAFTIILALIWLFAAVMAVRKRRQLLGKSRSITFRADSPSR
jgi:hypothetical protein